MSRIIHAALFLCGLVLLLDALYSVYYVHCYVCQKWPMIGWNKIILFYSILQGWWKVGWLSWGLTSQSTIFQSCRDGAIASWVINQYFRGVKCLAQGHNTAAVGLEPRTSRSGVRHSTTEPPRSPMMKRYTKTWHIFPFFPWWGVTNDWSVQLAGSTNCHYVCIYWAHCCIYHSFDFRGVRCFQILFTL